MKKTKILAFILAMLVLFQMIPVNAADNSYVNSDSAAVRLMVALDIMTIDEHANRFWEDIPIKRSEMAVIICKLYGLEAKAGTSIKFNDVSEKYRPYIETVAEYGYMSGYGDGRFGPEDYVTNGQLMKILVTMLGGQHFAEIQGGYPHGYVDVARRLGLRKAISYAVDNTATQRQVAEAIYELLHADILTVDGISGNNLTYAAKDGYTFLSENLDVYMVEGIMTADDVTGLDLPDGQGDGIVKIGGNRFRDPKGLTEGYLGHNVIAYEKHLDDDVLGEIIYIEKKDMDDSVEIDRKNVSLGNVNGRNITYYENDNKRDIDLEYAVSMIYNGFAIDCDLSYLTEDKEYIKFIDNDDDNLYEVIVVYDYSDYLVQHVLPEEETIRLYYGEKLLDLKDYKYRVYRDGEKISLSDISADEVISVAVSPEVGNDMLYTIRCGQGYVQGKVGSMWREVGEEFSFAEIKGKEYELSDSVSKLINKGYISEIKSGLSGKFLLNAFGQISTYTLTDDEKVAYLAAFGTRTNRLSPQIQIALYTHNRKLEIFTVSDHLIVDGKKQKVENIVNNSGLLASFNQRQLVKVKYSEDGIASIRFPKAEYDAAEFSTDLSLTKLYCRRKGLLDDKYMIDSSTLVFKVPATSSTSIRNDAEVFWDENLYSLGGSGSISTDLQYAVELYDVMPNGVVKYVLMPYTLSESQILNSTPLLLVESVGGALDSEGDVKPCIYGYDEKGQEVKLLAEDDEALYDDTQARKISSGDVIQYYCDNVGKVRDVKVCNPHDFTNVDYTTTGVGFLSSLGIVQSLGKVGFVDSKVLGIYNSELTNSPMDVSLLANAPATKVLCYKRDGRTVYTIDFGEINVGEEVFAVVNKSNVTRMMVVYR